MSVSDSTNGFAGGLTIYQYDALNRLTKLTQTGNQVSEKRVDFVYNSLGQYISIKRYSDLAGTKPVVETSYLYDGMNRLVDLTHKSKTATVAFYHYTFDVASRITQIINVDGTVYYSYDNRDELTGANYTNPAIPDEFYQYDAHDNRTASHLSSSYSTETANRLTSDGTYNYEYDDEGNMTRRTRISGMEADGSTVREYNWDHRNRLIQVINKTAINDITSQVDFTYDSLNRRIAKTTPESSTLFVYDRKDVLLDLASTGSGTTTIAARYMNGPGIDQTLAINGPINSSWLLVDHLGTPNGIVDNIGNPIQHSFTDAFGNEIFRSSGELVTRYSFTGREADSETGLVYYRSRYYDSTVGRFISEDSLRFSTMNNLYSYVSNNVTGKIDPTGEHELPHPMVPPVRHPDVPWPYAPDDNRTVYFTPKDYVSPKVCGWICGTAAAVYEFTPPGRCMRMLTALGTGISCDLLCDSSYPVLPPSMPDI